MRYQLQRHFVITFGTKQGVFTKAIEETLSKRFCWQHSVPPGVIGHMGRYNICKLFSHLFVTYVSVKTVISNSLKTFWQYVLNHSSDEFEYGEGFMFNLLGFVVTIPVADRFAIIPFNPSYRNRGRDDILCQVFCQSLTARGHLSVLKKSDKAFGIIFPGLVDIFFNSRIRNLFSEHFQEVVLPFSVHDVVWDIRNRFPLAVFIQSSCCHEDMEVGVVMAGSSSSLENDNVSDIEFGTGAGIENIFEAGMSCLHEWTEQCGIAIKPGSQELRHGQDHMAISNARQEPPTDEVCPSVGIDLGTGKTKARLAGESDTTYLSALAASVLDKAHLSRLAAVEHFLYGVVVVGTIKACMSLLKRIPMLAENLLKGVFVNAFHGCPLRTTITELAG